MGELVLTKIDRASMANSLEVRVPFLDHTLFEKVFSLAESNYFKPTQTKFLLFENIKNYLPKSILNRKKQGFSAPDESWYRGENAAYIKDLLLDKKTMSSDFINPNYIRKIVNEHINERVNHRLLIWSFMNFEWWCRIYLNNEKIE
jgi:asparagine synthase (glutamine-hydrolysing)